MLLKSMERHRTVSWNVLVLISLLFFLWASLAANADVYNFYLSKPGAKKTAPPPEESASESDSDSESESDETDRKPVAPAAKKDQDLNQRPIIINNVNTNTNNVTPPPAVTAVPVSPPPGIAAPAPVPVAPTALVPSSTNSATVSYPPEGPSKWKFGLAGLLYLPHGSSYGSYQRSASTSVGGLAELGYHFSKSVSLNGYAGLTTGDLKASDNKIAGLDLEFQPFRVPITDTMDLLQVGVLIGGSTASAADDNWGSLHVGARAGLNFSSRFGISTAARINFGHLMFEGGITARL
jgi:hypothetical protein